MLNNINKSKTRCTSKVHTHSPLKASELIGINIFAFYGVSFLDGCLRFAGITSEENRAAKNIPERKYDVVNQCRPR